MTAWSEEYYTTRSEDVLSPDDRSEDVTQLDTRRDDAAPPDSNVNCKHNRTSWIREEIGQDGTCNNLFYKLTSNLRHRWLHHDQHISSLTWCLHRPEFYLFKSKVKWLLV